MACVPQTRRQLRSETMLTRRRSRELSSFGRTASSQKSNILRARSIAQVPHGSNSPRGKDHLNGSRVGTSESSSKLPLTVTIGTRAASSVSVSGSKKSSPQRKTIRSQKSSQPSPEASQSGRQPHYVTRANSHATNKAFLQKQKSTRKPPPPVSGRLRRAFTTNSRTKLESIREYSKAQKCRDIEESSEEEEENDDDDTNEATESEADMTTTRYASPLANRKRVGLRRRPAISKTPPNMRHSVRRLQQHRATGMCTRGQTPNSVEAPSHTSHSSRKSTRTFASVRARLRPRNRRRISKSVGDHEHITLLTDAESARTSRSSSSTSSPIAKRLRRSSHVSAATSVYSEAGDGSVSTEACHQQPLPAQLSCRLRSGRGGARGGRMTPIATLINTHHTSVVRGGSPNDTTAGVTMPSQLWDENKENRHHHHHHNPSLAVGSPQSLFKTPPISTRHAAHFRAGGVVPLPSAKGYPQPPGGSSNLHHVPSASLNQSQLSITDCASSITSSMRLNLNSLKSPEKLQGERLKKLKCRWIEHETDTTLDTVSQISALSPSVASVLNGTEQDSRERLMELLEQHSVKSWSDVFDSLDELEKIGEGVYGEVFQIHGPTGDVIKIFPIEGDMSIMDGSRAQMTFHSVYPEVYVSKRLTELSKKTRDNRTVCFSQLKRATLVKGKLPEPFVVQWRVYDALYTSENICLDHLPSDQLWIILEYEYAGVTLEKYKFTSYLEARSVFEQLSLTLAAAEAELQFEHRDLHWGNVLVRPTRLDKLRFRVNGVNYSAWTNGVRATIIDFTVSRMCYRGNTVYVDMSENPDIFNVYDGEYQNEIYRMMRALNRNDWRAFQPRTNLMWLHYLCDKLLHEVQICARGDMHFQAVYSELVALEEELRHIVQPPAGVVRATTSSALALQQLSRWDSPPTSAVGGGGSATSGSHSSVVNTRGMSGQQKNSAASRYVGAADFVARNFYFDSCRMSAGAAL